MSKHFGMSKILNMNIQNNEQEDISESKCEPKKETQLPAGLSAIPEQLHLQ